MLVALFNKISNAISFTFAIVVFSLMSAWLAASYAYTFIYSSITFSAEEARFVLLVLSVGLLAATLVHMVHFGLLHRIGFSGFSRRIRTVNTYLSNDYIFTMPDGPEKDKKCRDLLSGLYALPKLNLLYSSLYSILFVMSAAILYYLFSRKVQDVALMMASGISACIIYGYYSLNITEFFIGRQKVAVEHRLFTEESGFSGNALMSIKSKSAIVLALVALSIMLLTVMFRLTSNIGKQAAFISASMLVVGILIFMLVNSVEYSLKRIIDSTKDLARGGSGLYFPYFSNREFVEFSVHHNRAALEINTLRTGLEKKVDQRTMELNAANEELEAINANLLGVNNDLEAARRTAELDMKIAANLQSALLPRLSTDGVWDIALEFRPLAGVSGDFYDIYCDEGAMTGIVLFDVSGHGIASGLIAMIARSIVHKIFRNNPGEKLSGIISRINSELSVEISDVDYYLSGVILRMNGGEIEYINAAHPDMLLRRGRSVIPISPRNSGSDFKGQVLGYHNMGKPGTVMRFSAETGDALLLYSDCLVESKNPHGEEYGEDRIARALESAPAGSAREALDHIIADLGGFVGTGRLRDDLTVIVMKKKA